MGSREFGAEGAGGLGGGAAIGGPAGCINVDAILGFEAAVGNRPL